MSPCIALVLDFKASRPASRLCSCSQSCLIVSPFYRIILTCVRFGIFSQSEVDTKDDCKVFLPPTSSYLASLCIKADTPELRFMRFMSHVLSHHIMNHITTNLRRTALLDQQLLCLHVTAVPMQKDVWG